MKYYLIALCISISTMGMAQKKELKKVDRAIAEGNMVEALEVFKTINESEVEEKYLGKYKFYKAAVVSGIVSGDSSSYDKIKEAEVLLKESEDLGYENPDLSASFKNVLSGKKLTIINNKLSSGDMEGGLKIVEDIYQSNPENKDMLFSSAQLSYQLSDFNKATEKFQALLDFGYTGQSTTYFATNLATGVEENFPTEKLRDLSVNTMKTHEKARSETSPSKLGLIVNNLVWLYKNDNHLDKGKFVFEKALKRFPDDASLKAVTPEIYNNLGMMEEYKKATLANKNSITDPTVYDNLGISALQVKDYDNAISNFEASLKLDDSNFNTHVNLSNAFLEKGNMEGITYEQQTEFYKKALSHLESAHKLKPAEKNILGTMASLYDAFEMKEKSAEIKAKM